MTMTKDPLVKARAAKAAKKAAEARQQEQAEESSSPGPLEPSPEIEIVSVSGGDSGKLDRILEQMGILADRVAAVETGKTTFSPMRQVENSADVLANTYKPPEQLLAEAKRSLTRAGQSATGIMNSMEDPEYIRNLPPDQRPIFRSGAKIRINPECYIHGTEGFDVHGRPLTPRLWSDVLNFQRSEGFGIILAIQYMTKTWEPKYTVHVPGVTGKDGDGFHESELLPAYVG